MVKQSSGAETSAQGGLQPYLSPIAVWALSVGSAIGWGSLVVTGKTYLGEAGPMGSILGLLMGFAMMLMVANHYHFLSNRYPGTGGLYNYVKYVFGYDRAFLVAWYMFLVYIAIFWANATSIPLFARYFLGGFLRYGYLFSVFDYEVYLGEALATQTVIVLVALLCMRSKKATARSMVVMVLVFTLGITICFAAAAIGHGRTGMGLAPAFVPDKSELGQVVRIGFLSPWAYIGFESVSHSAAEYRFKHSQIFRVLVYSLIVTTALYIFAILLSISAYPEGCESWLDYINRLDEFEGLAGLPAFFAAHYYLGDFGVYVLMASLLALVLSSLIGMLRTLSRLCYAVAQDGIIPKRFTKLSEKQIPVNAILLVVGLSLPIPFLGRTTIGWIVDTTTFGATILYGFVSAAVLKVAKQEHCKKDYWISYVCMYILVVFLTFLLFPSFFGDHTIETETYVLMSCWTIIGLFFFNWVIRKDHARKFGKAIIVWVALLAFIVIMAMTWAERTNEIREHAVVEDIASYMEGTADPEYQAMDRDSFLGVMEDRLNFADNISVMVITILFGMSLAVMLVNYRSMKKWEEKTAGERDQARTAAYTDPLTGVKSKTAYALRETEMENLIRTGEIPDFGIIVCDVNGLKRINDTLGHKAGDEYIKAACRMLCEYFKHSPVFRVGGDEFVVLLEGHDYGTREETLAGINTEIEGNIGSDRVVISLGMAVFEPGDDESYHDVFKRADKLMYERKTNLKRMGAVTRE